MPFCTPSRQATNPSLRVYWLTRRSWTTTKAQLITGFSTALTSLPISLRSSWLLILTTLSWSVSCWRMDTRSIDHTQLTVSAVRNAGTCTLFSMLIFYVWMYTYVHVGIHTRMHESIIKLYEWVTMLFWSHIFIHNLKLPDVRFCTDVLHRCPMFVR